MKKKLIVFTTLISALAFSQNKNPLNTIVSIDGIKEVSFLEEINTNTSTLIIIFNNDCYPCEKIYDEQWKEYTKNLPVDIYYVPALDSTRHNEKNIEYYNTELKTSNSHIVLGETSHIFKVINSNYKFPSVAAIKFGKDVSHKMFGPSELFELKKRGELFSKLNKLIK